MEKQSGERETSRKADEKVIKPFRPASVKSSNLRTFSSTSKPSRSSDKYSSKRVTTSIGINTKSVQKLRHRSPDKKSRSHKSPEGKLRHKSDRKTGHSSPAKTFRHSSSERKLEIKPPVKKLRQNSPNKSFHDKSPERCLDSNSLRRLCPAFPSSPQFGSTRPNYLAWRTPPETEKKCSAKNEPEGETLVDILGSFQLRHYTYKSPPNKTVKKSFKPKTAYVLSSLTKSPCPTAVDLVQDSRLAKKTDENRNLGGNQGTIKS